MFFRKQMKKKEVVQKIFIYSGAGISQESGLSTFRDKNGIWENYNLEDVCNYRTWLKNYDLVHQFYNERRKDLSNVQPNEGHFLVASLQKRFGIENVINVTTNIDDLFERAGVKNTIYLHGNLNEIKNIETNDIFDIGHKEFDFKGNDKVYKPNVVFFNEICPSYRLLERLKFEMNDKDIVVTVGMSFIVVKPEKIFSGFIKTRNININLDEKTNDEYLFDEVYNQLSSLGLKTVFKI